MKTANLKPNCSTQLRASAYKILSAAVRLRVARGGLPVSLIGLVLTLPAIAVAAETTGVAVDQIEGVSSVRVLADGSVRVTLDNGARLDIGAAGVHVQPDGAILISAENADVIALSLIHI